MTFDPQKHHRQSTRLSGYNYADEGAYFVTICAEGRRCLFGEVIDGQCVPSEIGNIVAAQWGALPQKYPHIELDEFIVMPNHIHGILIIKDAGSTLAVGAGSPHPTLGQMMGFYKYQTTVETNARQRNAGQKLWQQNYYDHIIRNSRSMDAIREYIYTNAERWADGAENLAGTGRDDVRRWVDSVVYLTRIDRTEEGGETPPLRDLARFDQSAGGETRPLRDAIELFIRDTADWGRDG